MDDSVHVVVPVAPPGCGKSFFRAAVAEMVRTQHPIQSWHLLLDERLTDLQAQRSFWSVHKAVYERTRGDKTSAPVHTYLHARWAGTAAAGGAQRTPQPGSGRTIALLDMPGGDQFWDRSNPTSSLASEVQQIRQRANRPTRVGLVLFVNTPLEGTEGTVAIDGGMPEVLKKYLGAEPIQRVAFYYAAADRIRHGPSIASTIHELNGLGADAKAQVLGRHIKAVRGEYMRSFRDWERSRGGVADVRYAASFGSSVGAIGDGEANYDPENKVLRAPGSWLPLGVLETVLFCASIDQEST